MRSLKLSCENVYWINVYSAACSYLFFFRTFESPYCFTETINSLWKT